VSFYSWLITRLRNRRYSYSGLFSPRLYTFGAIYEGTYKNWKHDPTPMIWIMYSDAKYTHGINLHYLNNYEQSWFIRTIYIIKKYQQAIDGRIFYNMLKQQQMSIVKKAYRVYFTNMLNCKLTSAGITNMEKLVYSSKSPFINTLNKIIAPQEMAYPPRQVSYYPEELRDRIIQAQNSIPINQATVSSGTINNSQINNNNQNNNNQTIT